MNERHDGHPIDNWRARNVARRAGFIHIGIGNERGVLIEQQAQDDALQKALIEQRIHLVLRNRKHAVLAARTLQIGRQGVDRKLGRGAQIGECCIGGLWQSETGSDKDMNEGSNGIGRDNPALNAHLRCACLYSVFRLAIE